MVATIDQGIVEMVSPRQKVDRKSMVLIGLFFLSVSMYFLFYTPAQILNNTETYFSLLKAKPHFILQDTGFLFYYGGWVILLTLLSMGGYSLFLAYKVARTRSLDKKIVKLMGYSIILGFILMISGKFVAQLYWSHTFEQAGYIECDNSFGMTQSWSTKVWTLNSSLCTTPFDPNDIWQNQAATTH